MVAFQSSDDSLAVQGEYGAARNEIMHESIKRLVNDVHELKVRSDTLETANAELKAQLNERDAAFVTNGTGVSATLNLSGYAASDDSSSDSTPQFATKSDVTAVFEKLDGTKATVLQILESFKEHLEKEVASRQKIEKDIEKIRCEVTGLKGRIGKQDGKIKTLEEDIDEKMVNASKQRDDNDDYYIKGTNNDSYGLQNYFSDKVEKLEGLFNMMKIELIDLQDDFKAQGTALSDLQDAMNTQHAARGRTVDGFNCGPGNETSARSASAAPTLSVEDAYQLPFMKSDIDDIKADLKAREAKEKMEQVIDNAANGPLKIMYTQINSIMTAKDNQRRRAGPFEGTFDELFLLRDRIVSRLALADLYVKTLREVDPKKAKAGI